jgi:hypothetical protein
MASTIAFRWLVLLAILWTTTFSVQTLPADEVSVPMLPVNTSGIEDSMGAVVGIYDRDTNEATRKLAAYLADANGNWTQPIVQNSGSRSFVPLRLNTPSGMVRIELSVTIEGATPEQSIDALLDEVIKRASDDSVDPLPNVSATKDSNDDANGAHVNNDVPSDTESPKHSELASTETAAEDQQEEPTVEATAYVRDSLLAKLERLVRATGATGADRDELRWMLDQWRPGPLWLISRDAVSPPQRLVDPVLSWLDNDRDGNLDAEEQNDIVNRLVRLDTNRDRIVLMAELDAAILRDRRPKVKSAPRLTWNLAWDNSEAFSTSSDDSSPTMTMQAIVNIRSRGIVNQVASVVDSLLNTKIDQQLQSQLTLRSDQTKLFPADGFASATFGDPPYPMRLNVYGYFDASLSAVGRCQFSVAANLADRQLWYIIDTNGDERLTEIEQRAAAGRLMALDRNKDAVLSPDEWPLTLQLAICQGNGATEMLQSSAATPATAMPEPEVSAPDWFTGMDSNRDGVLTRDEFLGSTDQFSKYDQDKDGFVTPLEITLVDQP